MIGDKKNSKRRSWSDSIQHFGALEIMAPGLVQTKRKHRYVVVSWRIGERKIDSLQRSESRFSACVGVRDMEPVPSILNDDSRFRRFVVSNAYFEKTTKVRPCIRRFIRQTNSINGHVYPVRQVCADFQQRACSYRNCIAHFLAATQGSTID